MLGCLEPWFSLNAITKSLKNSSIGGFLAYNVDLLVPPTVTVETSISSCKFLLKSEALVSAVF